MMFYVSKCWVIFTKMWQCYSIFRRKVIQRRSCDLNCTDPRFTKDTPKAEGGLEALIRTSYATLETFFASFLMNCLVEI